MKYLPLLVTVVVFALTPPVLLAAEEPTPKADPAASNPFTLFNAVFARVGEKAQKGPITVDDVAPELEEMDAIIAKFPGGPQAPDAAALYMMRARVYIDVLEDYPKGLTLLKEVKTLFPKAYANAQVGKIVGYVEEKMRNDSSLYIGKVFPPIDEKDMNGKSISTAKLKGKVVLVSFWASWSGQCVAELSTQLALYQKYHAKGFEIIGISADEERNDLKAMIAKKNLPWPQYCDGRGWKGRVIRQYGVSGVPFSCLLDAEGKIIGKTLPGPALEQKLAKLFGE